MTIEIRPARPEDLDGYYVVSLATGDAGRDAAALYEDGRMMGHVYSAPYLILSPETCLTLADSGTVMGFVVGALDTRAFEARLEREWWPDLRRRYPDPGAVPISERTPDQRRAAMIHYPSETPDSVVSEFPAHCHLNLLPAAQGRGFGRALFDRWRAENQAGSVHIATHAGNSGGIAFWGRLGFGALPVDSARTVWMGLRR